MSIRPRTALAVLAIALAVGATAFVAGRALASDERAMKFHDIEEQTRLFHRYYNEIELTGDQKKVFEEALAPLPAPCCQDRSALTCCCKCNQGRAWWGLAKHLIAEKGWSAEEVRGAVAEWFEFTHPDGPPSGRACYSGRCPLPFREDGCGGMNPAHLAF